MRVEGSAVFHAPRARVYELFTAAEALAKATPGMQSMAPAGDDRYEAVLKLGVAGISGTYNGSLALTDRRPPEHYALEIAGQGSPGFVKGTGNFDFAEDGDSTRVDYVWDVQVGGLVAGVGQRVLGGVAKLLIGQFIKAMDGQLSGQ